MYYRAGTHGLGEKREGWLGLWQKVKSSKSFLIKRGESYSRILSLANPPPIYMKRQESAKNPPKKRGKRDTTKILDLVDLSPRPAAVGDRAEIAHVPSPLASPAKKRVRKSRALRKMCMPSDVNLLRRQEDSFWFKVPRDIITHLTPFLHRCIICRRDKQCNMLWTRLHERWDHRFICRRCRSCVMCPTTTGRRKSWYFARCLEDTITSGIRKWIALCCAECKQMPPIHHNLKVDILP